jgi:hypothetical protein
MISSRSFSSSNFFFSRSIVACSLSRRSFRHVTNMVINQPRKVVPELTSEPSATHSANRSQNGKVIRNTISDTAEIHPNQRRNFFIRSTGTAIVALDSRVAQCRLCDLGYLEGRLSRTTLSKFCKTRCPSITAPPIRSNFRRVSVDGDDGLAWKSFRNLSF